MQSAILEGRIAVVTTAGFPTGKAGLSARLAELGIDATVYSMLDATELPTVETVLTAAGISAEQQKEFIDECRRIGEQLLDDGEERRDAEWRAQREFGYGNFGLLIVSSYNTPTVGLTAMWSEGQQTATTGGRCCLAGRSADRFHRCLHLRQLAG